MNNLVSDMGSIPCQDSIFENLLVEFIKLDQNHEKYRMLRQKSVYGIRVFPVLY